MQPDLSGNVPLLPAPIEPGGRFLTTPRIGLRTVVSVKAKLSHLDCVLGYLRYLTLPHADPGAYIQTHPHRQVIRIIPASLPYPLGLIPRQYASRTWINTYLPL